MKKEKAIEILQRQHAKLDDVTKPSVDIWITQTASHVKSFFGEDSPEYHRIKDFRFWSNTDVLYGYEASAVTNNVPIAKKFIENCIETIRDKGLMKREWKHILITTHPAIFWSVFSAIVALAFWLGTKYKQ